ncbi:MAG TPA: TolC family protein [Candidatus Saccharimonadales bacterium]|nr:TolC family protein [Candidatus Saccharimonadales bacterium]
MKKGIVGVFALFAAPAFLAAQQAPPAPGEPPRPTAEQQAATRISLEEALRLALQHNHALLAARSTILQNQAQETTANLRPNPTISWDSQFFPLFNPSQFNADYLENNAQFDLGIGYTFERGKKRQHRLQAAKDQTAVTRSQVTDNERQLTFNVSAQFIAALLAQSTLDFARQDLDGFQKTVDISSSRYQAGDMSESDLLKIKLQLLQFQSDVNAAKLAKVQALAALRQFLGFESVPDGYDVSGDLDYEAVHAGLDDLKALALRSRPDLIAAQQGITAARSQLGLAEANGKKDLGASFAYTHTAGINSGAFFFNMDLPIFDRNQGEIARTRYAITQSEELASEASEQVISDVVDAYAALHSNDEIIQLYRGGYVEQARQSRDISEYAYKRGAASLLDFLDAERTYRSNQVAYRQALASYMAALEQLRQATGTRTLP